MNGIRRKGLLGSGGEGPQKTEMRGVQGAYAFFRKVWISYPM